MFQDMNSVLMFLAFIITSVSSQPNIIVIVADDLGWNDLSFHGSPQIPTPNLDSLARKGVILNSYYVCAVCSPSRGALMTGLYPIHTGLQHGVISANRPWGLPLDKKLLPEWLKDLNYEAHSVGKLLIASSKCKWLELTWCQYADNDTFISSKALFVWLSRFFQHHTDDRICVLGKLGLQHEVIYVDEPWGLPLNLTLLPQHLKKLGYSTHAVGKWHLGFFRKEYTPTYRGFDSHLGYWGGKEDYFDHSQQMGEMWGVDFHHNMSTVRDKFGQYSTEVFTDHAVNIINSHNVSKPLFLYVAYQAVHSANSYAPLQAPPEYVARFSNIEDQNRRTFAGMVSAMDDGVGSILNALEKQGMLRNSVIVFTTDNGGPAAGFNNNAASNWPLRGVKATLWEGGVRGISFIWSSLLKNGGRVSMDLMHITDWLPTLYYIAGGNVKSLGPIDGYNMWDSLSLNAPSPRTEVLLNIDPIHKVSALRVGPFKVVQGTMYNGSWDGWYGPSGRITELSFTENNSVLREAEKRRFFVKKNSKSMTPGELKCGPKPGNASTSCQPLKQPCLFNVVDDPCEYYNLASEQKMVLSKLLSRLAEYSSTAVPPGNKPVDPMSNPKFNNYEWINWGDYADSN